MSPILAQTEPIIPESPSIYLLLVCLLAGFVGVVFLLPRAKKLPIFLGALAGTFAIILTGLWLIQFQGDSLDAKIEMVLFYAFSGMAILSGGIMITQTKPVRAALSFAMVVLSTCGLFLLQAAPFLMVSTMMVYAVAIVVTLLFVIMLAQQSGMDSADHRSREPFLATLSAFVFLGAVVLMLFRTQDRTQEFINPHRNILREVNENREQLHEELARIAKAKKSTLKKAQAMLEDKRDVLLGDLRVTAQKLNTTLVIKTKEMPESSKYKPLIDKTVEVVKECDNFSVEWWLWTDETKRENLTKIEKMATGIESGFSELEQSLSSISGITLIADSEIKLSPYQQTSANQIPKKDKIGRSAMPANNVNAIGLSLFTDNLLAVEMVAVLLLVATIGAIAIAGRQAEKLR